MRLGWHSEISPFQQVQLPERICGAARKGRGRKADGHRKESGKVIPLRRWTDPSPIVMFLSWRSDQDFPTVVVGPSCDTAAGGRWPKPLTKSPARTCIFPLLTTDRATDPSRAPEGPFLEPLSFPVPGATERRPSSSTTPGSRRCSTFRRTIPSWLAMAFSR